MALQGLVDGRGRPFNQRRHGGVKATMFIHFLIVTKNIAIIPMMLNLVSYLHGTMHMGIKDASTTSTNFFGTICFFFFISDAFISDAYMQRFYTILIFAPIEIMGYMLLACQAHVPSLHPPPCDITNHPNECTPVSGKNLSLLTLGLYLIPLGDGSLRACAAALGGDQFDSDHPEEMRGKISYFNWFAFCLALGGFLGLVFLVWVQENEGWGLSFVLAALLVLLGTVGVVGGLPFYRHQKPKGSPLTRVLQVFVAAFRKRKLSVPENLVEAKEDLADASGKRVEFMERTPGFKFLEKAAVDDCDKQGAWSLCTVTQGEEAKIILRMLPIFLSSVLGNVPMPLLLTLTVQQGGAMDTRLGATNISPASLFIVPFVIQMIVLVTYDRAAVPLLRRFTGYSGGVTHLQRVGVGFASSALAPAVAALVEEGRRRRSTPAMSVFWLTPQFFLLGVMDVTSFVGLLEFFYSEASVGMKSIGSAIVFCVLGVASWLGIFLIQVVNRVTSSGGAGGHGWLDGATLNASRLDLFYWLLALFGLLSFFIYLLCACMYTYRHDPRMKPVVDDDMEQPESTNQAAV